MMGFWIFLIGITLYVIGSVIESFAKLLHGGSDKEEEDPWDLIEDTEYTYETLLEKYGSDIADGVLQLSENQSISDYVERKKAFINQLETVSDNILIVEIADKLQNLISDYEQYKIEGKEFLITSAKNFDDVKWFYLELKKLFNSRIKNNRLLERYNQITYEYFES